MLYAYDRGEPSKQPQALVVLNPLAVDGWDVSTSQVLAEFFVNATRRLRPPLTTEEAYDCIQNCLLSWEISDITGPIVLEAVRGVRICQMAYWDAQIWASAKMSQIPVVLSEDFGDGVIIKGVRFVNPFSAGFNLETWLLGSKSM